MDKNTFIQLAKEVYRLTLLFPNKEPLRYKIREAADDIVAVFIAKENDYLGDLKVRMEVIDSFFEIALAQDWTSPAKVKEIKNSYDGAAKMLEEMGELRPVVSGIPAKEDKRTDFILIEEDRKIEIISPLPKGVAEPIRPLKPMVVPQAAVSPVGIVAELFQREEKSDSNIHTNEELEEDSEEDGEDVALTASQVLRQNRIREFLEQKGGAQVWEIQKIFPNVSKRTIRRDFHSMLKQGLIERTGERNTTAYKLKINIA